MDLFLFEKDFYILNSLFLLAILLILIGRYTSERVINFLEDCLHPHQIPHDHNPTAGLIENIEAENYRNDPCVKHGIFMNSLGAMHPYSRLLE
jgi:hypothetical protein